MKKITAFVLALLINQVCNAQIIDYHENMEIIDSVFSAGNPGWFANQRIAASGVQCDSSYVVTGDTSLLETMPINLTGKTFVTLSFKHICKISFFDSAFVEVFNGVNWIQLTAANMIPGQPDSAIFAGLGNKFSEASFIDWQPGQATLPENTWWKTEGFDVSALIGNVANAKVRWKLYDAGAAGGDNHAGWFVDDVQLIAAPCELTPPVLVQNAPLFQNIVLYTGPFNLNATIADASGLDTASLALFYSLNGGAFVSTPLTYVSGNNFTGIIPQVNDSDTLCYYFSAFDASACHNATLFPASGCTQFVARSGISLPFCDGFDFNNFWTDTTVAGSSWQLGVPVTSPPFAHSAPNSWEVALNTQYLDNTITYLYGPPMDFSGMTNAKVNFWFYKDCELGWDGARMDYSIDGGLTWNVLGNVGTGINWYNDAQLNSSLLPAWTGIGNTWVKAEHSLAVLNNQPQSRLRFAFTSDLSFPGNGFAIDDFCIDVPPAFDAALTSILQPSPAEIAGQCVPIEIQVANVGQQTLTSFDVVCSVNGGTQNMFPYIGTLLPGDSTTVVFPCFIVPAGNYTICAWLNAADINLTNDTICEQFTGVQVIPITDSVSYCDNFDGANYGWVADFLPLADQTTVWQLGTPAYGLTSSTHSPPNAWDINLTSKYNDNANTVLYSPYFSVSANANPKISFWQNRYTELNWDGVILQYSIDSGISWITVGTLGDTTAVNWYNDIINCSGVPAWDNNSNGWVFTQYRNLSVLNSQLVRFRFVFCSDPAIERDGFSIDDFCFGQDTVVTTAVHNLPWQTNELALQAIPNPAGDQLKFNYSIPSNGLVQLQIMDIAGRNVVTVLNQNVAKGNYSVNVETKLLNNGVYFYRLTLDGKSTTKKLVIRK